MAEEQQEENFLSYHIQYEGSSYMTDILVDAKKIGRADHDLKDKHNFDLPSMVKRVKNLITRENIIYFGIITGEEPIEIEQTNGSVNISVINKDQIFNKLKAIKERSKIAYIHISTIQLILKSTFALGIESPIMLELRDDRMLNQQESVIAAGKGNLKHGKIRFNLNYQVSMSLLDENLDGALTLYWEMKRQPLMRKGNHPFSITWQINYALTNSHHSLSFKPREKIEIDTLFQPIINLEHPKRVFQINNIRKSTDFRTLTKTDNIQFQSEKQEDESSSDQIITIKENPRIQQIENSIKTIENELGLK